MTAYTIFALGTFENTENESNAITEFYKACIESPYRNEKLILNGPQRLIDPSAVEDNVILSIHHIITWLAHAPTNDGKYRINLVGFSRGGVTCVRIANRLNNYLKHHKIRNSNSHGRPISLVDIEVNIFAIDSVAGLFEKYKKYSQYLPAIVKKYVGILQEQEYRKDLEPQDNKRIHAMNPRTTIITMYPLYGHHCSSKKIVARHVDHCTKILWQQLYRFLIENGTQLRNIPAIPHLDGTFEPVLPLSDLQILELFAEAKHNRSAYESIGDWGASFSGNGPRSFVKYLNEYVADANFFMNQFERTLFKNNYPVVMKYLFEGGDQHGFRDNLEFQSKLLEELIKMQNCCPKVFGSLEKKGVRLIEGGIIFPAEPTGFIPLLLADIVMNRLFRYRHLKPEWKAFTTNDEYSRTIEIEEEINEIRILKKTETIKNQLIITLIEKHAREMYQAGSESRLINYLQFVLNLYGRSYERCTNTGVMSGIGKLVEMLGSGIKKITQVAAAIIGCIGFIIEFCGNVVRTSGAAMVTALYWTRIGAPVAWFIDFPSSLIGNGLSILGRGIKEITSHFISPLIEFPGKSIRKIGQWIVSSSESLQFKLKSLPDNQPIQSSPLLNPELKIFNSGRPASRELNQKSDLLKTERKKANSSFAPPRRAPLLFRISYLEEEKTQIPLAFDRKM